MKPRDIALAVGVTAIWGVNFVVIKVGLDSLSPLLFNALRFSVAAVPAIFFVGRPRAPVRWIVATGLALGVAKFSLLFAGIAAGLPAGLSALVLQSQAVFTLVFAGVLLHDKAGRRRLAGVALSVAGIGLIASRLGFDRPIGAFALVVAAGAAWGLANVAIRKAGATDMLNFMVWVSAAAAPPLIALTLTVDGPAYVGKALRGLDLTALGAIGFVAWISTLVGFGAWGRLISRYGAGTVAPFAALAPVFAIVATGLLLGERVTVVDVVGGVAVLSGVLLGSVQAAPARVPRTAAGTTG